MVNYLGGRNHGGGKRKEQGSVVVTIKIKAYNTHVWKPMTLHSKFLKTHKINF
jgi:hypothetical protein